MANEFSNASPAAIHDLVTTFARVFDRTPKEYEIIHQVTIEHLQKMKAKAKDEYEHVAEHFQAIYPLVVRDDRVGKLSDRILGEYDKMPVTPEIKLRKLPGENSFPPSVIIGGAIGVVVAACIVGYCLGGPDPAPGESVEARCT